MNDEPRNVWERYVRSWKVAAPAEKRQIYATCLAPGCVYTDPLTRTQGWDELAQYMAGFHAAIEVTDVALAPEGMVSLTIPAATYARFEHRGPATRVDHTVSYAYAAWLPQSGHRHTYAPDLEIYGSGYHPTNDDSVFHYAIPIAARAG